MTPAGLAALDPLAAMLSPTELRRVASSLEIDGLARRAARAIAEDKREEGVSLLTEVIDGFGNARAVACTLRALAGTVERRPRPPALVWSGPQLAGESIRTTHAIVRLIDEAEETVLASTYSASVSSPFIEALRRAAERKLRITVVTDVAKLANVAQGIAKAIPRATLYGFHHSDGKQTGLQHSKFLVMDGRAALVTSANLSNQAVDWNLETGVLVEDSGFASQITRRVADLVASEHLRPIV
jgi:cardiolipin synthase